jgi:hypothetical protein
MEGYVFEGLIEIEEGDHCCEVYVGIEILVVDPGWKACVLVF